MPNYTENLQLAKPLQSEQYNIDVFNANADKIDQFAGQTPARALTADKLTTGAKINGVNFKGDSDVVTGAGFYYDTVTYGAGDLAFIYNQDGALELHKSLSAGNIGHNPLTSTGYWEKQDLGGSGGRNVGEIITSALPLTDAGLHLLDGTLLQYGIYKEFIDYIADLYAENPSANYFCTESDWQSSVSTYGVCGKFVYDSTNNTVRLPKVTGKIDGTTDINALGDLEPLFVRLPNITGTALFNAAIAGRSGALYVSRADLINENGSGNNYGDELAIDASRSSSVYSGNGSNTAIHEQAIKVLYYIVIANSTKTEIQTDIDEIATDLNGKADTGLTNITDTGYVKMAGASMPSNTQITLTLGADGATYTAPADGWVIVTGKGSNTSMTINQGSTSVYNTAGNSYEYYSVILPVRKGNFTVGYRGITLVSFAFIYAQGSESEAS